MDDQSLNGFHVNMFVAKATAPYDMRLYVGPARWNDGQWVQNVKRIQQKPEIKVLR